jgi:hypothetical protein
VARAEAASKMGAPSHDVPAIRLPPGASKKVIVHEI